MKNPYGWGACFAHSTDPSYRWQLEQSLDLLQPARWMTWHWEQPVNAPGFVPTLWSDYYIQPQFRDSIIKRLREHGPETWLFLNEPHLIEQANMTPKAAVDMVFWFLNLAHQLDVNVNWCGPNCAINMGAQVESRQSVPMVAEAQTKKEPSVRYSGKEWQQEWLRLLRRKGIAAPSQYGVHLYNGTDRAMVSDTWASLRDEWRWQFMGRDKPVIITEHCAENEPISKQIEVMDEMFRLLQIGRAEGPSGNSGVMGAFWFVAHDYRQLQPNSPFSWFNCALCEVDPGMRRTMRLTELGRHWKSLQARLG